MSRVYFFLRNHVITLNGLCNACDAACLIALLLVLCVCVCVCVCV